MTQIRPRLKKNRWDISRHEFYAAAHYAYQYSEWKAMYNSTIGISAVNMDGMPRSGKTSDPTELQASVCLSYRRKMDLVEDTVREADEEMYPYLLEAVTTEGVTYNYLSTVKHMPFCKNRFYDSRRKFYYLFSKKMQIG